MRCEVGDWVKVNKTTFIFTYGKLAEVVDIVVNEDGERLLVTSIGQVYEDDVTERRPGGGV